MNPKNIFFDLLGYFMIFLFVAHGIIYYQAGELHYLWWFSNHAPLIIGLALLYRSKFWLTAEVSVGLVPELIWASDFLSYLFTGKYLFGVTSYLSVPSFPQLTYILALQHLIVIPLAVFCLWVMGTEKQSYFGAFLHATFLWVSGYAMGPSVNINCSQRACVSFLDYHAYVLLWPFFALLIIWISYRVLLFSFPEKPIMF